MRYPQSREAVLCGSRQLHTHSGELCLQCVTQSAWQSNGKKGGDDRRVEAFTSQAELLCVCDARASRDLLFADAEPYLH